MMSFHGHANQKHAAEVTVYLELIPQSYYCAIDLCVWPDEQLHEQLKKEKEEEDKKKKEEEEEDTLAKKGSSSSSSSRSPAHPSAPPPLKHPHMPHFPPPHISPPPPLSVRSFRRAMATALAQAGVKEHDAMDGIRFTLGGKPLSFPEDETMVIKNLKVNKVMRKNIGRPFCVYSSSSSSSPLSSSPPSHLPQKTEFYYTTSGVEVRKEGEWSAPASAPASSLEKGRDEEEKKSLTTKTKEEEEGSRRRWRMFPLPPPLGPL